MVGAVGKQPSSPHHFDLKEFPSPTKCRWTAPWDSWWNALVVKRVLRGIPVATGKGLIITEKPSVARDITAALGGFKSIASGVWESDEYLCTHAVGHILQLLEPEDIDPRYRKWSFETLPCIPEHFGLKPIPGHEARLTQMGKLASRKDVTHLINACDAAREGELIFREIIEYLGCRKWTRRLWLRSMTQASIRKAFQELRDGTDFDSLGAAASCRSYADWLIGMNGTRAASERMRRHGGQVIGSGAWSVGRVQTPTLTLLVKRELEILEHRPKTFYRVKGSFQAPSHLYEGTWFDASSSQNKSAKPPEAGVHKDRIFDRDLAARIVAETQGQQGTAEEKRDKSLRQAPRLFHLTGLQRSMASRYHWDSKRTLEAAQRCYEQHKVLTYPRTNSQCLPKDYKPLIEKLWNQLQNHGTYGGFVQQILTAGPQNISKIFDDHGVDDHFAIIPTGVQKNLTGDDAKVYDAVMRRFIAAFYPPAIYDKVVRTTTVAGHKFRTGPVETLRVPGWLEVYGSQGSGGPDGEPSTVQLPPLDPRQDQVCGVTVKCLKASLLTDKTKPPQRISEAQLLGLMEFAGRHVEDEALAQALVSAEGLGTAATRADIIQNLKIKGYIDAQLRPLFKGMHLILSLQRIHAHRVTSPELTGKLELELSEVERGKRRPQSFMQEMTQYVRELVDICRDSDLDRILSQEPQLGPCPACKQSFLEERALYYGCAPQLGKRPGCGFRVFKEIGGRYLDRQTMGDLLKAPEGRLDEVEGFDVGSKPPSPIQLVIEGTRIFARDLHGQEIAKATDEARLEQTGATTVAPWAKKRAFQRRGSTKRGSTGAATSGASKASPGTPHRWSRSRGSRGPRQPAAKTPV